MTDLIGEILAEIWADDGLYGAVVMGKEEAKTKLTRLLLQERLDLMHEIDTQFGAEYPKLYDYLSKENESLQQQLKDMESTE